MTAETVRSHQEQKQFCGDGVPRFGTNRGEWKPDYEPPLMLRRQDLPSCRLRAAKHHTSRRRFRDQSVLLVGYVAFNVADSAAPLHNGSFRFELCLPDRAKEIDFQFDGSEGFLRRKRACKPIPITASAISQRIPPCSVPMGFACCGPAAKTTVARPSAMSFASNPISRAMGTSFVFARSLKSACEGIS